MSQVSRTICVLYRLFSVELARIIDAGDPDGEREHALRNRYQKLFLQAECIKERGLTCEVCKQQQE